MVTINIPQKSNLLTDFRKFIFQGLRESAFSQDWNQIKHFINTGDSGSRPVAGFLDLSSIVPSYRSAVTLKNRKEGQELSQLLHPTPYQNLPIILAGLPLKEQVSKRLELSLIINSAPLYSKIDLQGCDIEKLFLRLVEFDQKIARIESNDIAPLREHQKLSVNLFKLHRQLWKERADVLIKLDKAWELLDPKGFARAVEHQVEHALMSYNNSRGYLRPSYENRLGEIVTPKSSCLKNSSSNSSAGLTERLLREGDWRVDTLFSPLGYRESARIYRALYPESYIERQPDETQLDLRRKQEKVTKKFKKKRLELIGE